MDQHTVKEFMNGEVHRKKIDEQDKRPPTLPATPARTSLLERKHNQN